MRQTWRWFGPGDTVSLASMRQAGVEGVVSALHHVPNGAVWSGAQIARRQVEIDTHEDGSATGLKWEVVESLPVSEDIKQQRGDFREHISNYKISLNNLASAGIGVVCYNFMPVLDWTRTDLAWKVAHGGTAMRFDLIDFAAYDIHILQRPGGAESFPEDVAEAANDRFSAMSDDRKAELTGNVTFGLPGSNEKLSLDDVRAHLAQYGEIGPDRLRGHLIDFLSEVVPHAERLGLRLCCHPDDPPFPLLGLPRILSTEADYAAIMQAVDSPANGITLCSGSLGVRADNDLPGMMARLGDRVHFIHLRNVARDSDTVPNSFHEAEHLEGATDMVALIAAITREENRRHAAGRADWNIPMRPDHGQNILDDIGRAGQPGYPAIGRLKGLAELRGIMRALTHKTYGVT